MSAWGYAREFNLDEIIGTLPKVKGLGIKSANSMMVIKSLWVTGR